MLTFTTAGTPEIPALRDLAHRIWHAHYPGIITVAQIDYMLARYFSPEALELDLAAGTIWELAWLDAQAAGFLACAPVPELGRLKLSKLYLLPELHGRGHGQQMLARVKAIAARLDTQTIQLTVNKQNARAIRAYQRAGFAVTDAVRVDIGHGFVMDDYLMTWSKERGRENPGLF